MDRHVAARHVAIRIIRGYHGLDFVRPVVMNHRDPAVQTVGHRVAFEDVDGAPHPCRIEILTPRQKNRSEIIRRRCRIDRHGRWIRVQVIGVRRR